MNFHGQEPISRPPRATGRTALFFGILLGLSGVGWIIVADTSLLGLQSEQDKFVRLLQLLCVLSTIGHVVEWYWDDISYRGWKVTGKLSADRFWRSKVKKMEGVIEDVVAFDRCEPDRQKITEQTDRVAKEVTKLRWNINSFHFFARIYVFGWHLVVPISVVIIGLSVNYLA